MNHFKEQNFRRQLNFFAIFTSNQFEKMNSLILKSKGTTLYLFFLLGSSDFALFKSKRDSAEVFRCNNQNRREFFTILPYSG